VKVKNSIRYTWIDNLKGFAIIMMILSHCIPGESVIKTWISSFNMPLFFIIGGYLRGKNNPALKLLPR